MNTTTFFFKGESLLLPDDVPDSRPDREIPLDYLEAFSQKNGLAAEGSPFEVFRMPAIDSSVSAIHIAEGAEAAGADNSGGKTICYASIPPDYPLPQGWRAIPVRQGLAQIDGGIIAGKAGAESPGERAYALKPSVCRLLRAYHVYQWRRDYQFCANCGTKNIDSPGELAWLCPSCGRREFPRISPAVITIIINDKDQVLLAHNKTFIPEMYSLIAGFNEAGESLEDTVIREIREEVNIEVRDIRYAASQPWPFRNSLMVGFCARHAGGTIRADNVEIEDAQWFSRDKLPKLPGPGSVSRYLINRWIAGDL